jgi:hypothetical protein
MVQWICYGDCDCLFGDHWEGVGSEENFVDVLGRGQGMDLVGMGVGNMGSMVVEVGNKVAGMTAGIGHS